MFRPQLRLLTVCFLTVMLSACGDPSASVIDPRTQPPLIRTAVVQSVPVQSRDFSGIVAARFQSDLGFRVSGKVLERLVDKGQTVRRGDPLMRLDPADFNLQAHALQEAVNAAQARARQASEDERRYQGLVSTGAVSVSAYGQIRAAAAAARADLSAAQAQSRVALNASAYAVLTADSDGVVVDTLADPGQVISAGQTVIRLARAGQREALVNLPETLRPATGSVAQALLFGSQTAAGDATLRQLSDAADPYTRTYEARYVLSGPAASAPLGATVSLRIPEATHSLYLMRVPLSALYDAGKGPGVWVTQDKPARVTWRQVNVIALSDEDAHVTGNLHDGEQVAALGAHLLHEGENIRTAAWGDRP